MRTTAEDAEERKREVMHIDEVSGVVVDAAMKVHTVLGLGLLEGAYLKMTGKQVGLLIDFNVLCLKNEIRRLVNNHQKPPRSSAASAVFIT
jgi:hypothetical protein